MQADVNPIPVHHTTFLIPWGIIALNLLATISLAFPFYTTYIALPRMMVTMRVNLDTMQWVLTGFSMAQTVMMPMVGWFTNRFGLRNFFVACLGLTIAGSVGCGLAWNVSMLIGWRIVQGLGAGPLSALASVIMFEVFPSEKRGLALGVISANWALGALMALPLGGYLIEALNWRAIFFFGVPCGVVSLILSLRYLSQDTEPFARELDVWGAVALVTCLVPLLLALSQGQRLGWDATLVRGSFLLSAAAAVGFLARELLCEQPLLDLRLFTNVSFAMTCLVRFLNHIGFNAYNLLIALYLQLTLDYTPLQAGMVILPSAVAVAPASLLIGRLIDRLGPRLLILSGLVMLAAAVRLFSSVNPLTPVTSIIGLVVVLRVSSELMFAPLNYTGLLLLPGESMRAGAGILSLMWSIGGTLGNVITAVALQHRRVIHSMTLGQEPHGTTGERDQALSEIYRLLQDSGYSQNDLQAAAEGFLQHYMHQEVSVASFQDCFLLTAAVYLVALLPALIIRLPKARSVSPARAPMLQPAPVQETHQRRIAI